MKNSLSNILIGVLCAALLCTAVCFGAVRGWNHDRQEVLSALTAEGEMRTHLEYRGMDAANLCVVAARHLPADDADLLALRQASDTLLSGTEDVQSILEADAAITDIALRFGTELPALASVQASKRDSTYIIMLTDSLSVRSSLTQNYTLMVEDFNARMAASPTGMIAMFFGVDPIPLNADN